VLHLASGSPRRKALLTGAGVDLTVCAAGCDEQVRAGEDTLSYVRRMAADKLAAARAAHDADDEGPWLAADTVVWFPPDGELLLKPANRDEARDMVQRLTAGTAHCVTTAWAFAIGDGAPEIHEETTRVWMRSLTSAELDAYLRSDEWADKAGGYGIQGTAMSWVTRLEGSYTNVVGLPLAQVLQRLRGEGRS
jgi:septum formation protein